MILKIYTLGCIVALITLVIQSIQNDKKEYIRKIYEEYGDIQYK